MDLESTIETIASYIPEDIDLEAVLSNAASYIPAEIDFAAMAKFMLLFAAGSLVMGLLGRVVLGKRSSLNHSLSSVMAILFIYAVTVVVYTFKPWNLAELLSPLPFVTFVGEFMVVLPFEGAQFTALCHEILSLVILAFLVNLLDSFIPQGKNVVSWFLLRLVSVVLAMLLHLLVRWAFDTYLPDVLVTYAPTILLLTLIGLLFLGVLNILLSVVLTAVNPVIGGIYAFFFSNAIGKQLTKAVFSAAVICVVAFLLGHFGYTVISISVASLTTYIPMAIILLLLWYVIGHVL